MKDKMSEKIEKRVTRHRRIRAKMSGTEKQPRLSVFRSRQHIYGQLVDDEKGKTIVSASDREIKKDKKMKKADLAKEVGKLLAKKAGDVKIKRAVFDRGGYKFHGRVKSVAQGAREGGLEF